MDILSLFDCVFAFSAAQDCKKRLCALAHEGPCLASRWLLSQSVGCYPAVAGPIRRLLSLQPVLHYLVVELFRAVPAAPCVLSNCFWRVETALGLSLTVISTIRMPDGSFETTFPCISNSLCIGNGSKALEIIGQCSKSHREASNFPIGKRSEPRTLVGWPVEG